MFQVGEILAGKYRVEGGLGQGGMGYVLAATHVQLEQRVAIKFLMPELCENQEAVERFLREARAAVRIHSEHVARVVDVGTLDSGEPYMVMEFLSGRDLSHELDERTRLPVDEAINYLLQACEAVAEAHTLGVIHRDLKPANLFLTRRNDGAPLVKVLDFGVAKAIATDKALPSLTATQSVIGSPLYMSPEQVRRPKEVDVRTDVWSLGIILYEFLVGVPPFEGETALSMLAAIVSDPLPDVREKCPDLPEGLDAVIAKCLEKSPEKRYQDVGELAQALAPYAPVSSRGAVDRISRVIRSLSPPPAHFVANTMPSAKQSGERIRNEPIRAEADILRHGTPRGSNKKAAHGAGGTKESGRGVSGTKESGLAASGTKESGLAASGDKKLSGKKSVPALSGKEETRPLGSSRRVALGVVLGGALAAGFLLWLQRPKGTDGAKLETAPEIAPSAGPIRSPIAEIPVASAPTAAAILEPSPSNGDAGPPERSAVAPVKTSVERRGTSHAPPAVPRVPRVRAAPSEPDPLDGRR
jgi:serine/threonine protein kinase